MITPTLTMLLILTLAQDDAITDFSAPAEACKDLEHQVELFAFRGRPLNQDPDRPVKLLINHGYVVGFSPDRMQPIWAAYVVSSPKQDKYTHYERWPFFAHDYRLPESERRMLQNVAGYDRGHMVPNYAIGLQYGKLAQMETFFMSNICPQKANLNRRIWADLESAIVDKYVKQRKHIWVLCGPIFSDSPTIVSKVSIPDAFYMILVDTFGNRDSNFEFMALRFPQNTPSDAELSSEFLVSVDQLEEETDLNFFPRLSANKQEEHESSPLDDVWAVSTPNPELAQAEDAAGDSGVANAAAPLSEAATQRYLQSLGEYVRRAVTFVILVILLLVFVNGAYQYSRTKTAREEVRKAESEAFRGDPDALKESLSALANLEGGGESTASSVRALIEEAKVNLEIGTLFNLYNKQIEGYQEETRSRARASFLFAIMAMISGFVFLLWGGAILLAANDAIVLAAGGLVASIGGGVSAFIANTFLSVHTTSLTQLNHYFRQPVINEYILMAQRLADGSGDAQTRNRSYEKLIDSITQLITSQTTSPPEDF